VLAEIAELNAYFLEALANCAKRRPQHFPLPEHLRADFSRLTQLDLRRRRKCSVLLVDARFSDSVYWSPAAMCDQAVLPSSERGHWLSEPQGVLMALSVLMVAWHVVKSLSPLAGVLLGMNDGVSREFSNLQLADLAQIAQTRPGWIRPRWADRIDLWSSIVEAIQTDADPGPSPILHLLKSSATESGRMFSSMRVATTRD
jgi:hypothetical protein